MDLAFSISLALALFFVLDDLLDGLLSFRYRHVQPCPPAAMLCEFRVVCRCHIRVASGSYDMVLILKGSKGNTIAYAGARACY